MTSEEYKASCLELLAGSWREDEGQLEALRQFREDYLSGGWSEQDLDTLAALSILYEDIEWFAVREQNQERMSDIWNNLPVRDELRLEVIRKRGFEEAVRIAESVDEEKLSDAERPVHQKRLEQIRDDALAVSLGDFERFLGGEED